METDRYVHLDWTEELASQLQWHWENQLRPRLAGLTDDEYFWEPVPSCWSVRRRADATTSKAMGAGEFVLDYAFPEPEPAPVTTIAWRLAHITVGCFGQRSASHFDGPPADRVVQLLSQAEAFLSQLTRCLQLCSLEIKPPQAK